MRPNEKRITARHKVLIMAAIYTFLLSIGIGYCNSFMSGYWYWLLNTIYKYC